MGELAREPQFWVVVSLVAAILSGQITFGAHLVPIARQWGAHEAAAAGLLSLTSLAGMVGTLTPVVALIGLHGAAALPLFGMAVSERFGLASFERAFGLGTFAIIPFMVTCRGIACWTIRDPPILCRS